MILEHAHLVETRRWLEVQFLQHQFVINCKVTQEEYLEAVKKNQDPADCLLSLVLSWGHGTGSRRRRFTVATGDQNVEMWPKSRRTSQ